MRLRRFLTLWIGRVLRCPIHSHGCLGMLAWNFYLRLLPPHSKNLFPQVTTWQLVTFVAPLFLASLPPASTDTESLFMMAV